MWLLNIETFRLEQFNEQNIPPYAILSHRWLSDNNQEISFRDISQETEHQLSIKQGYAKVRYCCDQAQRDSLAYCWIDTCCINKDSSAELSEAINSMYRWYKDASICYAYLCDVPSVADDDWHHFSDSKWFKRGWTLQELLAPREVMFYSKQWRRVGTKSEQHELLSGITGIPEEFLLQQKRLSEASVAARMSWAALRSTTRTEDVAYCLLGIFGINMTLLYGEGAKAFIRLQEEILKEIDDQSILAWSPSDTEPRGVLARSPKDFAGCAHIAGPWKYFTQEPVSMTPRGLRIHLPFLQHDDKLVALLACKDSRTSDHLGIVVESHLGNLEPDELLSRAQHHPLTKMPWRSTRQGLIDWCTVFVAKMERSLDSRADYINYRHHFDVRLCFHEDNSLYPSQITGWWPKVLIEAQDDDKQTLRINPLRIKREHALIVLTQRKGSHLCLAVGFEKHTCGAINTESYWAGLMSNGLDCAVVEDRTQTHGNSTESEYTPDPDGIVLRSRICWAAFLDTQLRIKVASNTWTRLEAKNSKNSIQIKILREKSLGYIAHSVFIS